MTSAQPIRRTNKLHNKRLHESRRRAPGRAKWRKQKVQAFRVRWVHPLVDDVGFDAAEVGHEARGQQVRQPPGEPNHGPALCLQVRQSLPRTSKRGRRKVGSARNKEDCVKWRTETSRHHRGKSGASRKISRGAETKKGDRLATSEQTIVTFSGNHMPLNGAPWGVSQKRCGGNRNLSIWSFGARNGMGEAGHKHGRLLKG